MKSFFKKPVYILFLSLISVLTFSCLDSGSSKKSNDILEQDISIPFMIHAGSTHLLCGVEMTQLGSTNESGFVKDFRLFVHDVKLIDENGDIYPLELSKNNWQTQNVALLSFADKENCPDIAGETLETNLQVAGKFSAPKNALIKKLSFKVGVPFALNHEDPTKAESPLNIPSMAWNWQGGYKHMRVEAIINEQAFLFHLGSIGCDGDPLSGGTTACAHNNRPKILVDHYDIDLSAVEIDFRSLVENINVSAGGSCHSAAGQAAICKGIFDSLGLDFYDGSFNTLEQENEGQSVFKSAFKHD